MKRLLPKILQALTLLPALAAVVVLNVDWTRQGHIHMGSFGVVQHHHGHTGDHSHSHPHGVGEPHTHSAEEGVDHGSVVEEKSGQHGGSNSPEPAGSSDSFLASNLVLASEISPPISVGLAPKKTPWILPWVGDRPAPETRHRPSAPRGPPRI